MEEDLVDDIESISDRENARNEIIHARIGHIAVTYGDRMLVWSGYREYEENMEGYNSRYLDTNKVVLHNPYINHTSIRTTLNPPYSRLSGACGVVHLDTMFVFGGYYEQEGNTNMLHALDLKSLSWRQINYPDDSMKPLACDKMVGWEYDSRLFFFGGFGPRPDKNELRHNTKFVLDPSTEQTGNRGWNNQLVCFNPATERWEGLNIKGPIPLPRAAHAAAVLGSRVYVFGGRHQQLRMNDLQFIDMDTITWSPRIVTTGPEPEGRSWHSLTAVSDTHLVLYGGYSKDEITLGDCWRFDVTAESWLKIELPFNKPRLWHTACLVMPGKVLIYGGCTTNIHHIPVKLSTELVELEFCPRPLFSVCIETIMKHKVQLQQTFKTLPLSLYNLLINMTC